MKGEEGKGREERKGKRRWATGDSGLRGIFRLTLNGINAEHQTGKSFSAPPRPAPSKLEKMKCE